MNLDLKVSPGDVLNNDQLRSIFGCGPQGGMRRSTKTNTLVIVSNHVKSIYDDRWLDCVFHYTGMGMIGDQSLTFMQNKTLAESSNNGVAVHLFEVFTEQQYTYVGRMQLSGEPYKEQQNDSEGNQRLVWMFPLKIAEGKQPTLTESVNRTLSELKEKAAKKLTNEELLKRIKTAPPKAGSKQVITVQYDRNPWISEMTQRIAQGICQLCSCPAPFKKKDGTPYLETHHVVWVSQEGDDTLENTVALCPNCHRKMHILALKADVEQLTLTVTSKGSYKLS